MDHPLVPRVGRDEAVRHLVSAGLMRLAWADRMYDEMIQDLYRGSVHRSQLPRFGSNFAYRYDHETSYLQLKMFLDGEWDDDMFRFTSFVSNFRVPYEVSVKLDREITRLSKLIPLHKQPSDWSGWTSKAPSKKGLERIATLYETITTEEEFDHLVGILSAAHSIRTAGVDRDNSDIDFFAFMVFGYPLNMVKVDEIVQWIKSRVPVEWVQAHLSQAR